MVDNIQSLPPKQRQVLETILAFVKENGYPPSIQQLCELCGVSSTSTIHHHISALKRKGFIHWNPAEKRAISIRPDLLEPGAGNVPILGVIAAGVPLQVDTDNVEHLNLSEDLCPSGCYALRVRGESMIEDHIMDGDIVLINPEVPVRNGDVAVALVESETTTLKRIYKEKDGVRLQPANSSMSPIFVKDVEIQGKVEAIIRRV